MAWRRSHWVGVLAAFGLIAVGGSAVRAGGSRPNLLILYGDDQSYKLLGCYPEALPGVKTPNLDRLAQSGVRFHGAFLGAWCTPSRATFLTGRHTYGIESLRPSQPYPSGTYDPEQCRFWPREFRRNGYVTAQIGKWHTGVDAGTGRDWDWQIVWNRPKHPENAGAYYRDQLMSFNGEERVIPGYSTDHYSRWAAEFISGKNRDQSKPWALWLCYGAVHGPTTPAERHLGAHAADRIRVPADILPPRPGKPAYLDRIQAWQRDPDGQIVAGKSGEAFGDQAGARRATYSAFVQQMKECNRALDEGVGTVLESLRASGQLNNTLVIYTADQGFGLGEHGFRTKLGPYDATYRSPLIISQPGTIPAGKVAPHAVSGPDLVATLYARAGIKPGWRLHGRDLSPLLKDPARKWPHPVLYGFTGDRFGSEAVERVTQRPTEAVYNQVPWYVALRTDRWKYVRYLTPGETEELYDLAADPEELVNLAGDRRHGATLRERRRALFSEFQRLEGPWDFPPTKQTTADSHQKELGDASP